MYYLCTIRSRTMLEDIILDDEIFADEPGQVWIVAEVPSRDIAEQLTDLHTLYSKNRSHPKVTSKMEQGR